MPRRACRMTPWLYCATSVPSRGPRRVPISWPVMTMCSRPRRTSRRSRQASGPLMWWCPRRSEGLAGVAPDFTAYLDAMIAERKASADPPDDFVTRLITTEVDGERLTDLEMRTQLAFLLMSGNETTRHLIANVLETVCTDPALLARLHAERDLVPIVVEESLRHDSPIHVLMRDCLADVTIDDVTIPAGAKVGFGLASANRDERYVAPDEFRLNRPSAKDHLAFGGGPHVCPGAALARLEGRVAARRVHRSRRSSLCCGRLPARTRPRVLGQWHTATPREPDRSRPERIARVTKRGSSNVLPTCLI